MTDEQKRSRRKKIKHLKETESFYKFQISCAMRHLKRVQKTLREI